MCNNVHMMAYEYIRHEKQRLRCAHLGQLNDLPALVGLTLPGGFYGDTQSFPRSPLWSSLSTRLDKSRRYGHLKKLTPSAMTLYNDTQWLIFYFQMADGFICFFWMISGKIRIWDSPLPKINIRMWLW